MLFFRLNSSNKDLLIDEGTDFPELRFVSVQEVPGVAHVEEVELQLGTDWGVKPGGRHVWVLAERDLLEKINKYFRL